jgi:integrase
MKFTKDTTNALVCPAGKTDHVEWDSDLPGFGIRLRGSGAKSWIVQYRIGRQQRREALGDVRKVRLTDAREAARTIFAQVQLGIDPGAEREKAEAATAAAGLTLAIVIERYLADKQATLRASSYQAATRYFGIHWKPLHDRPIGEIKRAEVAAALQTMIKAHGRVASARARSNLSALFNWAMREGLCESNPVIATNKPDKGVQPRERVLNDSELAAIWQNCLDDDFGRIVKLLILTGCRREEIGALKFSECDLDTGIMVLPGSRTKTNRSLELKLPDVAVEILRSVPRREGREHVFGSRGGLFSAWSYGCLLLNARIAATKGEPLPHWTIHDLRRTTRTGMGVLGVPPHVAELVVNHAKRGVQAVYDKHTYAREIAQALAQWADHVMAAVENRDRKIVTLRA